MEEKILAKLKEDLEKSKGLAEKYELLLESLSVGDIRYKHYMLTKERQWAKVKYIEELIEFAEEL